MNPRDRFESTEIDSCNRIEHQENGFPSDSSPTPTTYPIILSADADTAAGSASSTVQLRDSHLGCLMKMATPTGTRSNKAPPSTVFAQHSSTNQISSKFSKGLPVRADHCQQGQHTQGTAIESRSLDTSSHAGLDFPLLNGNDDDHYGEDDSFAPLLPPFSLFWSNRTSSSRLPFWHRENVDALRNWMRRTMRHSGNYVAYCTLLTMLIVVPMVLYRALSDRKVDRAAFNSAWVMVCGTFILSCRLVYLHLTHWFMPDVQKYVVRILWMVPIYAIQSYLSLRFHHARVYMSAIRDFYEAFVIASFVYYLMELLGGQDALIQLLQLKNPSFGRHVLPFKLVLQPWEMGIEFYLQCKHGVLQYVVFKTTATILTFLCESVGVYGEGQFEWFMAYPYLCFFQNISVMYALYCLVIFFHAVNDELRHPVNWHPLGKFLCIKGVVFFTWWQGVVIFYLRSHGVIEAMGRWSSSDVANGLIDYCIVIEMVAFAIAHSYTFTHTEYLPGRLPPPSSINAERNVPHGNTREENENNNHFDNFSRSDSSNPQYRPPATLPQPMKFRDALWSSTVPNETLQDIQRLRAGVDGALSNHRASLLQEVSLQEINSRNLEELLLIESDADAEQLTEENISGGDPFAETTSPPQTYPDSSTPDTANV